MADVLTQENAKKLQAVLAKAPWIWLRDERGNKSASLTLSIVAFSVVTLWLLLSIFGSIGPMKVTPFSASDAMAFLVPVLSLYGWRRHTKSKDDQHKREVDALAAKQDA